MTELLHLKDGYLKTAEAKVVETGPDYVVLDRTVFYPEGGGQPTDTGFMTFNGTRVPVGKVTKEKGIVKHFVQMPLSEGSEVSLELDWDRRYAHMRMHTAQHLLSALVLDEYGASTAGNQIGAVTSRMDFCPLKIDEAGLKALAEKFNAKTAAAIPVKTYFSTRDEVLADIDEKRRRLFKRVPESVKDVRIVEIEGVDKCPCAGTHVANTHEIGSIKIGRVENKGKDTVRFYFSLVNP